MSIYTEAEHTIALADTLRWIDHPPISPQARYAYGLYQLRLKDYNEAFHWFLMAANDGVQPVWFDLGECLRTDAIDPECFDTGLPDREECYARAFRYYSQVLCGITPDSMTAGSHSLYRLGFMYRYGLGTDFCPSKAFELFHQVIQCHADLTPEDFNIACSYSIEGSGISDTTQTDICKLPVGDALYELGIYYIEGIDPVSKDIQKGRKLLKKAYDFHCESALFLDFARFGQNYAAYEYQDDIRELFSFRIGQYGRICDVHPSRKAYERLIAMYENGYPGDEGERKSSFALKAKPLYKKMELLY